MRCKVAVAKLHFRFSITFVIMELVLKRIAKRKTYTIGKLGILPAANVDVIYHLLFTIYHLPFLVLQLVLRRRRSPIYHLWARVEGQEKEYPQVLGLGIFLMLCLMS